MSHFFRQFWEDFLDPPLFILLFLAYEKEINFNR